MVDERAWEKVKVAAFYRRTAYQVSVRLGIFGA
jgi:hypothetical protein